LAAIPGVISVVVAFVIVSGLAQLFPCARGPTFLAFRRGGQ
jgi:hypothetical protein